MAWQYFRLLAGEHIGNNEEGKETYYATGSVVPSESDLEKRWPEKFRRVDGETYKAARAGFGTPTEGKSAEELRHTAPAAPTQSGALIDRGAQPSPAAHASVGSDKAPDYTEEDLATFDTMTVQELKDYAAEEDISLGGAGRKDEIVKTIKDSLRKGGR